MSWMARKAGEEIEGGRRTPPWRTVNVAGRRTCVEPPGTLRELVVKAPGVVVAAPGAAPDVESGVEDAVELVPWPPPAEPEVATAAVVLWDAEDDVALDPPQAQSTSAHSSPRTGRRRLTP